MRNNFVNQLQEEMEILYQLLEESQDIQQQDAIIKMLVQLTRSMFIDTRKIS